MSVMNILDKTGDTILEWDKDDSEKVEAARKVFEEKTKQGYTAYKLGEKLTEFDPASESIILVPKVEGGYPACV